MSTSCAPPKDDEADSAALQELTRERKKLKRRKDELKPKRREKRNERNAARRSQRIDSSWQQVWEGSNMLQSDQSHDRFQSDVNHISNLARGMSKGQWLNWAPSQEWSEDGFLLAPNSQGSAANVTTFPQGWQAQAGPSNHHMHGHNQHHVHGYNEHGHDGYYQQSSSSYQHSFNAYECRAPHNIHSRW